MSLLSDVTADPDPFVLLVGEILASLFQLTDHRSIYRTPS